MQDKLAPRSNGVPTQLNRQIARQAKQLEELAWLENQAIIHHGRRILLAGQVAAAVTEGLITLSGRVDETYQRASLGSLPHQITAGRLMLGLSDQFAELQRRVIPGPLDS